MRLWHILHSLRPRLPRPKTFLGFISLQKATEIISGILFFNKLTGAYGLLAILTGFSLSLIQLSAYIYNLAILILLVICIPHIRRETPLPNLTLAWAYTIDTLINAAYTATFAISWYLATSSAAAAAASSSSTPSSSAVSAGATGSIVSAAAAATTSGAATRGLRNDAASEATLSDATAAQAVKQSTSTSSVSTAGGGGWMSVHETTASLTLIVIVTVVRFYFCLVVISHSRQALQRYGDHVAEAAAAADGALDDDEEGGYATNNDNGGEGSQSGGGSDDIDFDDEEAGFKPGQRPLRGARRHHRRQRLRPPYSPHPSQRRGSATLSISGSSHNPFAAGAPAGDGWKGKLGRTLVGLGGQTFWLGRAKDDDWARDVNSRFRS